MTTSDFGPAFSRAGGFNELNRANPQPQQFVAMISAIYKRTGPLYDPDNALFEDANAWAHVLRDDRFRAFISMRLAKVARLNWTMEAASDRTEDVNAASTVEMFLRDVMSFTSSRRHLAKFAFWGRAHAWIEGRREWRMSGISEAFPDGMLAEWWCPTLVRPLDKRQVIYSTKQEKGEDGKPNVRVETLLGTIDAGRHERMQHPECLVTCVYDDEVERLGYGRGLLETLYHIYWIKGIVRRLGLAGLEKWANGIVAAKVDGAARGAVDDTTAATAQAFLDSLMAMRTDGAIVVDSRDDVEVLTLSGTGGELTLKWLAYCDEGASMLCAGSIRPMGGGDGGTYGQGKVEAESSDDLLDCDRDMLDEAITRSVVQLWWDMNASNLAQMGLGAAKMPRFKSMHTDREDPEKFLRTVKLGQECGMEISADDAHRRSGIPRPAEGDDILEAPKPEPPPGFGGPGLPGGGGPPGLDPKTDEDEGRPFGKLMAWLRRVTRRKAA